MFPNYPAYLTPHNYPRRTLRIVSARGDCAIPEIVTTAARLEAVAAAALAQSAVAVDIESNGFYRYPERVCLVQLATADGVFLVDPLAVEDVGALGELLAAPSVLKIFHAADYDVRSLRRDWGFHIKPLFDTGIAAAFAGSERLGLAAALKEYLGVEVSKSKQLQRADWTIRPLSRAMVAYAAEDVAHLERLAGLLRERLDALGRREWVAEECERLANARHTKQDAETGFLDVKGSRGLDGKGLAVLRALYLFREREALRRDRPPFKVFSDAAMLALAANPRADVARVKGIGRYGRGREGAGVRRAVRQGLAGAPVKRPPRGNGDAAGEAKRARLGAGERGLARERLKSLKDWRLGCAKRLGLHAGLVWPAASLERLALRPRELGAELAGDGVRRWQRAELGESLAAVVDRL